MVISEAHLRDVIKFKKLETSALEKLSIRSCNSFLNVISLSKQ